MRKKLAIALIGILIVLAVAAGLVAWLLDSERLGALLLERAGAASGVDLQAGSARVSLFSGLRLRQVSAAGSHSRGRYELALDGLVFEWKLLPLISGEVVINRIRLDRPLVRIINETAQPGLRSEPEAPAGEEKPDPQPRGPRLEVLEMVLREGTVVVIQSSGGSAEEKFRLEDLDLVLRDIRFNPAEPVPVRRVSGTGHLTARQLQAGKMPLRELSGKFALAAGILKVPELSVVTDYGPVKAEVRADFNPVPMVYELRVEGTPLDTNRMAGLGETGTLGEGRLEFQATGSGVDPDSLRGAGRLQLADGRIPEHEILRRAERLLGLTGLSGGEYRATDGEFELAGGRLNLSGFSLQSDRVGMALAGWVDLDGPLDLQLNLQLARQGIALQGAPPQVLDMLADENGRLTVPFQVTGDRQAPAVAVDRAALMAQARQGIGRRLGSGPRDLLDRVLRPRQ